MAETKEEAIAKLAAAGLGPDGQPIATQAVPAVSRQQAQQQLLQRGLDLTGEPQLGAIQRFGRGGAESLENIAARAGQSLQRLAQTPGAQALPSGINPLSAILSVLGRAPQVQTVHDPRAVGTAADIGRVAGTVLGLGGIAAPLGLEAAPAFAADAILGASQDPDKPVQGALIGGLTGGAGRVVGHILSDIHNLPKYILDKPLQKAADAARKGVSDTTKRLYDIAFKDTDNFRPTFSLDTREALGKLNTTKVPVRARDLVESYFKGPNTLRRFHLLRSGLGKVRRSIQFSTKAAKSGLDSVDEDAISALQRAEGSINNDLETNFNNFNPEKFKEFQVAQSHFFNNEIPFRTYKSVRDAIGKQQTISPALRNALRKRETDAERLRQIIGVSRGRLGLRKGLGVGVPLAALAGGGEVARRLGLFRTLRDIL